jgi:hypothetical protein
MSKLTPILAFMLVAFTSASAQTGNIDSLNMATKISVDSSRLLMLQHKLADATIDKQAADANAQEQASQNANAAGDLSSDPDSKKLARKANREAGQAMSAAKKARKAGDEVTSLSRDIEKQKNLLARDQSKMSRYTGAVNTASALPMPVPVAADTTIKN